MPFPLAPFTITSASTSGDAAVVTVEGELDLHTRSAFARELLAARGRGATRILLDLLGVTFLDSTAVGVVAATARELTEAGGQMHVVTDSPHTLRVFDLMGVTRFVRVHRTMHGGLECMAEAA